MRIRDLKASRGQSQSNLEAFSKCPDVPKKQNGDLDLHPFCRQGPSTRGLISPRGVVLDALLGYVFCLLVCLSSLLVAAQYVRVIFTLV